MDAYADALGVADKPKTVVPPEVLDGLRQVESSGNALAVNPQTGAMGPYQFMPGTVAMLRKQGVKFDPFDENESRAAAESYLGQLIEKNGGDIRKALGQYGGFVTKDPTAYVDKVLTASKASAPATASASADPYGEALGIGGKPQTVATTSQPIQQPATPAPKQAPVLHEPSQVDAGFDRLSSSAGTFITGLGANIVGGYKGLATLLTAPMGHKLEDAGNAVTEYVNQHTHQEGTPESFGSPLNPINAPGAVLDAASDRIADNYGPVAGTVAKTAGNAALLALGVRGRAGTAPVEVGPSRPGTGIYRPVQGMPQVTIPAPGEPGPVVPQPMPKQPAPATAATAPAASPAATYAPPPAPGKVTMPQPLPTTPEGIAAVAQKAPSQLFPETPTVAAGGKFTPAEQMERARILKSVGIEDARNSALTGDAIGGSTDFQTSKVDSPAGRQMKAVIEGEKQALVTHADSLIQNTGGTHGVDQSALLARGNTIIAPLDGLKQWFDNNIRGLYQAADERAKGVPTTLENFKSVLGDASELTNSDRVHLQGAVNAYLKKLGMVGEDGSISGNAQAAETVRKYLNEQWSPQNSKWVGKLKDALDDDVTKSAGEDIYAQARQVRALRGATLDDPNGIAKLMDASGPEGINRAVATEKIADSVTGMPVAQFSHIVKTLREVPDELQPQSQAALAEIKAQFANKVQAIGSSQQGQWNAKGVTKYLQNNAARMAQIFTPEEIAAFRNLNDAGHIVAKDQSYPGAAVQAHNLVTQGTMHALPTAGAAAGGFIGGPVGAAVGAAAGKMAAGAVENAATLRAVRKRTTKLSDLLRAGQ